MLRFMISKKPYMARFMISKIPHIVHYMVSKIPYMVRFMVSKIPYMGRFMVSKIPYMVHFMVSNFFMAFYDNYGTIKVDFLFFDVLTFFDVQQLTYFSTVELKSSIILS